MVVFPLVPVTPTTSSSALGSPKKDTRQLRHGDARVGNDDLRRGQVKLVVDGERDGAAVERLRREVVPVRGGAAQADEERPRRGVLGTVCEVGDGRGCAHDATGGCGGQP